MKRTKCASYEKYAAAGYYGMVWLWWDVKLLGIVSERSQLGMKGRK